MSDINYGPNGDGAAIGEKPRNAMLLRLAYTLGFGVLAWALLWFSFALSLLQLIVTAVAGQRNPQLAAGPIALASADAVTLLVYFNLARWLLA